MYLAPVAAAAPYFGNLLHALGIATLTRLSMMPELPTVAGKGFVNAEAGNWYGLSLPMATLGDTVKAPHFTSIATLTKANKRLTGLA